MTKTMKITLTEDFLVPTDDGNIIFEPGDEIEVEYEDDTAVEEPVEEIPPVDIETVEAPVEEPEVTSLAVPAESPAENSELVAEDPLTFAANPEVSAEDDEEVFIEDPVVTANLV